MSHRQQQLGAHGLLLLALAWRSNAAASAVPAVTDPSLTTFYSRPDIKAPLWNITTSEEGKVAPGYWFVAPYHSNNEPGLEGGPCHIGPHIYNSEGELVWSGACQYGNRKVWDFKANVVEKDEFIVDENESFVDDNGEEIEDDEDDEDKTGPQVLTFLLSEGSSTPSSANVTTYAMIVDNNYGREQRTLLGKDANHRFEPEEFRITDNGTRALAMYSASHQLTSEMINSLTVHSHLSTSDFVRVDSFLEWQFGNGTESTEWTALDYIHLNESTMVSEQGEYTEEPGLDYAHVNSIHKFPNGDFLISARHTNTIYRINATTKTVEWRLGGDSSDFELDSFNFSRQNDARILEADDENQKLVISLFDNAAGVESTDTWKPTANHSRALVISVDTNKMVAKLLHAFDRPDGELTREHGNVQKLKNGNYFVCWGGAGYVSEFTESGDLVLEASLATEDLYTTNRGYKFDWKGVPDEDPVVKAFAYGATEKSLTTVAYVSWNGDTQVDTWKFYEQLKDGSSQETAFIGEAKRTGFETLFMYNGFPAMVSAEGVDKDGHILRWSDPTKTVVPKDWKAAGWKEKTDPEPEDPSDAGKEDDEDEKKKKEEEAKKKKEKEEKKDEEGSSGFMVLLFVCSIGASIWYGLRYCRRCLPRGGGGAARRRRSVRKGEVFALSDDEDVLDYRDKDGDDYEDDDREFSLRHLSMRVPKYLKMATATARATDTPLVTPTSSNGDQGKRD